MHHASNVVAGTHLTVQALSENVIYLMGLSFVLGSFFTVLILLLLDFMRRDQAGKKK